jgi:hypothetical protein
MAEGGYELQMEDPSKILEQQTSQTFNNPAYDCASQAQYNTQENLTSNQSFETPPRKVYNIDNKFEEEI